MNSLESQIIGTWTLLKKELLRFWRVAFQTVAAPVISGILYLLIFSHVLDGRIEVYDGVPYMAFLIPGLIMMSLLQNAFSNSSSSLIQAKVMGNIVFLLLTPLSYLQLYFSLLVASIARGIFVGICIFFISIFYIDLPIENLFIVFLFAVLGGGLMGSFGIIAGVWAERFDQMAAFGNFVIMPLSMLSGVFYSIHSLSPFWQKVSHLNPFFYMIDGFRYGFFGQSDTSPYLSLLIVTLFFIILAFITIRMLKSGYKLRG
jgi:ABC-2 type transport system permease protein|tara:strand:- start:508 stop:1284 length:777 start_codon:yes stop_codon:yes gene_type:complete